MRYLGISEQKQAIQRAIIAVLETRGINIHRLSNAYADWAEAKRKATGARGAPISYKTLGSWGKHDFGAEADPNWDHGKASGFFAYLQAEFADLDWETASPAIEAEVPSPEFMLDLQQHFGQPGPTSSARLDALLGSAFTLSTQPWSSQDAVWVRQSIVQITKTADGYCFLENREFVDPDTGETRSQVSGGSPVRFGDGIFVLARDADAQLVTFIAMHEFDGDPIQVCRGSMTRVPASGEPSGYRFMMERIS